MPHIFDWTTDRDQQPREVRGVSFERVVSAIEQGGLLDVVQHPNQDRYAGQLIYILEVDGYAFRGRFVLSAMRKSV